jgi:AraC-like DNA-binding protein
MSVQIINRFPDYSSPDFNMDEYINTFRTANVIVHARSSHVYYGEHWGTFTIKTAFGGEENYFSSGCRYRVNDKSFLIINKGCEYSSLIDSVSPVESLALFFTTSFTAEIFHYINSRDKELLDNPLYYKNYTPDFDIYTNSSAVILERLYMVRKLLKDASIDAHKLDYLMRDIFERILSYKISEAKFVTGIPLLSLSAKKELYKRLGRVKDYIHSNYSDNISINNLAELACLCPHHLVRRFKKFYGITPHQYLTRVRIDSSKNLLVTGSMPVSEICSLAGFESVSSFSTLFSRHTGLSPLKYRQTHSKKSSI